MDIRKLEAVPGGSEARLLDAPKPWYKHPGAYVENERRKKCLERLHERARVLTSENPIAFLGGFRYVLASAYAFSNRVSHYSYYDGLARDRMTTALIALARHAGLTEAGMVPGGAS